MPCGDSVFGAAVWVAGAMQGYVSTPPPPTSQPPPICEWVDRPLRRERLALLHGRFEPRLCLSVFLGQLLRLVLVRGRVSLDRRPRGRVLLRRLLLGLERVRQRLLLGGQLLLQGAWGVARMARSVSVIVRQSRPHRGPDTVCPGLFVLPSPSLTRAPILARSHARALIYIRPGRGKHKQASWHGATQRA
jgi:hypothetical protein